ncbi:MAG: CocE/NonD family hydrolase [Cyanobium sp.]
MSVSDTVMVCADGVGLATRLWTPEGEGPWPVLLMRQPYGRAIASTVTYAHPTWYAERGFVVAVQDVRGRGNSNGAFLGFAGEAADGAAAVRWARSLPGANGRVGTYGFSYQGLTQLLNSGGASADRDPDPACLPDCLVPAMAGLDERRHWASEGGAHWWAIGLAWALQLAAEGCRRRGDHQGWEAIRRALESGSYPHEGLALLEQLDPQGMGLRWLNSDPRQALGWLQHRPPAGLLQRPMLLIGGWHDPHLHGVLDLWQRAREAGGTPGLVVGPFSHLDWRGGLDALQLAFFRRHLGRAGDPAGNAAARATGSSGKDQAGATGEEGEFTRLPAALAAALEGGIALMAEGSLDWFAPLADRQGPVAVLQPDPAKGRRDAEPPAPAEPPGPALAPPAWRLHSDGRAAVNSSEGRLLALGSEAEAACPEGGTVMLVHDPWRPVPSRGGHLGLPPGAVERGDLDGLGDVACFTSAALPQPLRLVGRPRLHLPVAADQPGFDLCVALSLLAASGGVRQVSTGVLRVLGEEALHSAKRAVELQPLALQLGAGDRLRIAIAAAAWPAIAVNAGDGRLPRGGSGPGHRITTLALDLRGAALQLDPLLSGGIGAD